MIVRLSAMVFSSWNDAGDRDRAMHALVAYPSTLDELFGDLLDEGGIEHRFDTLTVRCGFGFRTLRLGRLFLAAFAVAIGTACFFRGVMRHFGHLIGAFLGNVLDPQGKDVMLCRVSSLPCDIRFRNG